MEDLLVVAAQRQEISLRQGRGGRDRDKGHLVSLDSWTGPETSIYESELMGRMDVAKFSYRSK